MGEGKLDVSRRRRWKLQDTLALISALCVVATITAFVIGRDVIPDLTVRFWIFGLGSLGSILGAHLYMGVRFADRNQVRSSLSYLGVLSVATSVGWFLMGLAISFYVALRSMSSRPSPEAEGLVAILRGTVLLPFQVGAWLEEASGFRSGYLLIYVFFMTAGCLFLLSVVATGIYPRRKG